MMKLRKFKFGVFLLLFILCGISAEAANCQLHVSLGEEGSQVELAIYQIAEAKEDTYQWLEKYDEINIQLTELKKAKELKDASEKIHSWIEEKNLQPDKNGQTNDSGEIVFAVDSGAYLIVKESKEGEMAPVLVMIPEGYDSQTFQVAPKYSEPEEVVSNVQNTVTTEQKVDGAATGDSASPILWLGMMAVAAIVIIFLVKSKQNKND